MTDGKQVQSAAALALRNRDRQMNKPDQQLVDEHASHVSEYIAHLEEALRGLPPAPRVNMRLIPTPPRTLLAMPEQTRQARFSLRN